ncbi:MAG TPA: M48 family metalloprotease [Burkholderiales bacterium]|nr:M48 family metalloprotease [Burkholderiales bacterium]
MSPLATVYFDGKTSARHEVGLLIGGGKVKLVGRDIELEYNARKVRVAPRLGNTPRWLYLPGGGACVVADNDAVDRFTRERPFTRLLNRLEARPAYAVAAIALVAGLLWLLIDRGLPPAVEYIAERIPRGAETALGEQTLDALSKDWFQPSALPRARQEALRQEFDDLAKSAGDTGALRLEFRASPIGANAFALPSGIIVVTDDLVKLARNDQQVLAVLAHEIGHVRYRHTMRRLLQSSATALIIAAVTGDIASTTSLAASAPALLLQTRYSRDYEREADTFAIDLLQKTGIGAQHFAAILARLEGKHRGRGFMPTFLSSHPPTAEREALARAGAGASAEEDAEGEFSDAVAQLDRTRRRPPLALIDTEQKQIAELLEKRDFAALERALDARRLAFEGDSKASVPLENAFRTFERLPPGAVPALDEWVRAFPASYNARVARGGFWVSRGVEERGQDFYKETPKQKLAAMEVYFDAALAELERSLAFSEKPYLTRRYTMTIMLITGSRDELEESYREALKLAPGSVETRLAYMRGLEPRWRGSYREMEAYAAESRKALGAEDARRIEARIPAYRGFESRMAKDFDRALGYFDASIALDSDSRVLCERAGVLGEMKRYKEGFGDAGRGLGKARYDRYCMDMAVWLAAQVDDPPEVIRVMSLVVEVDSASDSAYARRGWEYQRTGKIELAFPDYLAAAKLGNAWAQTQVGKLYWSGVGVKRDPQEALVWLEKADKQGEPNARASLAEARKALGRPPQ